MTNAVSIPSTRRLATGGISSIVLAAALAACGSSAPASTAPSQAAPASVAPASVAPVATPTTAASVAPGGSSAAAVDPAEGLKIGSPYSLVALPDALQQAMDTQMASGLGAFASTVHVGFRSVTGGTGSSILLVMAFPTGTLNDVAYQAALAGMGSSMGATFTTTTVNGVAVSTGKAATGGLGVFHVGDNMIMVIAQTDADTLPVVTAVITANQ